MVSIWPQDYVEMVLNDIEKYNGIRKTKKAGLIERCMVKFCPPEQIHPNPNDEFSMAEIGPNFGVVTNYEETVRSNLLHGIDVYEEPLIVQKMDPDGYLLFNGHHRWFAARRRGVKKVHIQIVNLISSDDVNRMMEKTTNTKIASFDLDEVLLSSAEENQAPIINRLFSRKIKERLRKGAPEIIHALKEKGYDVWIYSSGYTDEEGINDFFSMYDITIDGMLNGINEKKNNNASNTKKIKELMDQKYTVSLHIDNEAMLHVDRTTKEYTHQDIPDYATSWDEKLLAMIADLK